MIQNSFGPVAQLAERAHGMREARGSTPLGSTKWNTTTYNYAA